MQESEYPAYTRYCKYSLSYVVILCNRIGIIICIPVAFGDNAVICDPLSPVRYKNIFTYTEGYHVSRLDILITAVCAYKADAANRQQLSHRARSDMIQPYTAQISCQ